MGATGSIHVGLAAIAKKSSAQEPFIVCNELVCSYLAKSALLPSPPGALIEEGGDPYFISLNFNLSGQALPPAPIDEILAEHPALSWGIILFDIWVMNSDRHRRNISYDTTTRKIQIFDHSHAFLSPSGDTAARLQACEDATAIGGHCLARRINHRNGLNDWVSKFQQVPDFYVEEVVEAAVEVRAGPAILDNTISGVSA